MDDSESLARTINYKSAVSSFEWFSFGTSSYFFIQSWITNTITGLSTAVVCSVVLVVIMTSAKHFIQHISQRSTDQHYRSKKSKHSWICDHVFCSAIYTIQVSSSYLLMLCVMSYDGWIIFSVVMAAGCSYLLLQPIIVQFLNRRQEILIRGSDTENTSLHHRVIKTELDKTHH